MKDNTPSRITYNDVETSTLSRLFSFGKKLECMIWIENNGLETAIGKKKVKLGTQSFRWKGRLYNIDNNFIQNRCGKLVYNVHINNSVGALNFTKTTTKEYDAKNANELLQRELLHGLWARFNLPWLLLMLLGGTSGILAIMIMSVFMSPDLFGLQYMPVTPLPPITVVPAQ